MAFRDKTEILKECKKSSVKDFGHQILLLGTQVVRDGK